VKVFWPNALANFVGSIVAAAFLWILVTRLYELPRSRKQVKELVSVSYALVKFELFFNELYCKELIKETGQIAMGLPVTQGWEVLHSTEAFRYLPPQVTGRIIMLYSLLFRLRGNVEFIHRVLMEEGHPIMGQNPYAKLRAEALSLTKQVAVKVLAAQAAFSQVLQNEIDKLSGNEKAIFNQTYQLYREKTDTSTAKAPVS
jgi:hypothetical protein